MEGGWRGGIHCEGFLLFFINADANELRTTCILWLKERKHRVC